MNTILLTFLAALGVFCSPDGRLQLHLGSTPSGSVTYSISLDGVQMLAPSPLGLTTDEAAYTNLVFKGAEENLVCEEYEMSRAKASHMKYEARRVKAGFENPDGKALCIEFSVGNSDVAFRYLLPREGERGSVRVLSEESGFAFPEGTTSFICPQSDAMVGWKRTKPSYEEFYGWDRPLAEPSEFGHGYTFPCLFRIGSAGWALVSETGNDSHYCGCRLGDWADGRYKVEFPMPEEYGGNGSVEPAFSLPGATPWRTVTVGATLAPIAETTVAFDLVEPLYECDWAGTYGKGTWSWILWQDGSINYDDQIRYIDLAREMGFSFVLIDNWWDVNIGRQRMEDLVKYAHSQGVDVFLWYSSSGWWNDIEQGPVNVMSEPISRKKEMKWLRSIGVKGIKVDFFAGDKQETFRHYENILSDAADYGLMVIFHGCTLPRGWERMYPNYVGSEAVRASENLIFNQYDCDIEALCATLHPFCRNAVGCMEYGGSFLNRYMHAANGRPDSEGRVWGNVRRTTDAFSLATAVIFQNPIQNFALAPNNLEDSPAAALDFLRRVPTVWDETRYIDGEPGSYAVIARRSGAKWYVGAVNAAQEPLVVHPKRIAAQLGGSIERVTATVDGVCAVVQPQSPAKRSRKAGTGMKVACNDGLVIEITVD